MPVETRQSNAEVCPICCNFLGNGVVKLNCGHSYHLECIGEWYFTSNKKSCPTCRRHFSLPSPRENIAGESCENRWVMNVSETTFNVILDFDCEEDADCVYEVVFKQDGRMPFVMKVNSIAGSMIAAAIGP